MIAKKREFNGNKTEFDDVMNSVLRCGMCVYNNIQKFIQFHITLNVADLIFNFVAAVSFGDVPHPAIVGGSHGVYNQFLEGCWSPLLTKEKRNWLPETGIH